MHGILRISVPDSGIDSPDVDRSRDCTGMRNDTSRARHAGVVPVRSTPAGSTRRRWIGALAMSLLLLPCMHPAQASEHPPLTRKASRARAPATQPPSGYEKRADVQRFIDEMGSRHGFLRNELQLLFSRVVFQPSAIKAITPPTEPGAKSWRNYRAIFVNEQRIGAGLRFYDEHARVLARASAQYGIPEEIMVAIIGVETVYGRNMGAYRIVDALSTLAFDYPPRAEFFRSELENYLLFARDTGIDVFSLRGSFAGAFGLPQFMPSSYRRFAVDYDGDGRPNLVGSAADAIGSVGNFLLAHGWKRDAPVAFPVRIDKPAARALADGGVRPNSTAGALEAAGAVPLAPEGQLPADAPCILVELESPGEASEYRAALDNFYVITRYNRSSFYAAAVMDLAGAIRAARLRP